MKEDISVFSLVKKKNIQILCIIIVVCVVAHMDVAGDQGKFASHVKWLYIGPIILNLLAVQLISGSFCFSLSSSFDSSNVASSVLNLLFN